MGGGTRKKRGEHRSKPTTHDLKDNTESQDKSADLSPGHFDSGMVADIDSSYERSFSVEDEDKSTTSTSSVQTWADSGVQLDSGLSVDNFHSDLDIKSPLMSPDKDLHREIPQVEYKDDLNLYQDSDGDTPLHLAVVHGDPHVVFRILSLSPQYVNLTNKLSQSALHLAVLLDHVRIVRRLVVCGGHLHQCDRRGDTPLHLACRLGHLECLKALTIPVISREVEEAGVQTPGAMDPRLLCRRNYEGLTCTHLAASSNLKVLEYVLQCGADINSKDGKSGKTVLHQCVEWGRPDMVHLVLSMCHADVNVRDYAQRTPLHLAHMQKGRVGRRARMVDAVVKLLREAGGQPFHLSSDSEDDTEDSETDEE